MPQSKHRKNHKKKVSSRNIEIKNKRNKIQKAQKEFIEQLIKSEQEKGMFDNDQTALPSEIQGPTI